MWQERQTELIRNEIGRLLIPLSNVPDLREIINEALEKEWPRSRGEDTQRRPWPLIPLIVCERISGHFEHAVPAAAAVELFKGAAEILDDIEDADSSESLAALHGAAIATNAATAMLVLAEKAMADLATTGVSDACVLRVVETANSYYTAACAGQHLDLRHKSDISLSEETYLEIAMMRSASHVECACCAGAILGGGDEQTVRSYSEFGRCLGIAAQIANDIRGITTGVDVAKRKVTLPVIEALAQQDGHGAGTIEEWFGGKETGADAGAVKDQLFGSGAIYYAVVKAEFYKERAFEALKRSGPTGEAMARLKMFIE